MSEVDHSGVSIYQAMDGFLHWRTPYRNLGETVGLYPPECIFVEVPDWIEMDGKWYHITEQWGYDEDAVGDARFVRPKAPEGWIVDEYTGTFVPIDQIPILLRRTQDEKQEKNKNAFNRFLSTHPLTWTDGKIYGVSNEDQSELSITMIQYQISVKAGNTNVILEWHAKNEACVPWTLENLTALMMAINAHIYPWFEKMNNYKQQIYACTERYDVEAIEIAYETEEEIVARNTIPRL